MNDAELSALLAAVQQGDLEAFEEIYTGLHLPLFTVLRRIVRDASLAEDLLQELFLRVYQAPPVTAAKPRAYLFQMARNLAIDALRRREMDSSLTEVEIPCHPDQDSHLDLECALASLSTLERQLVTLHLNGGLKFRELAKILNLPLGTALWRYQQALGRLRVLLNGGIL